MIISLLKHVARWIVSSESNGHGEQVAPDLQKRLLWMKQQEDSANNEIRMAQSDPEGTVRELQKKYRYPGNVLEQDMFPEQRGTRL